MCTPRTFATEHHWSYVGEAGPDKWGGLGTENAACSVGGQQSPVDIAGTIVAREAPLRIGWTKGADTIVNNGHTIQLDFADGDALHLGDRSYALKQFHFHHPSEHLVAGKRFAMEAHFVHAAA
jgi:carbonic anhydrase